MTNPMIPEKDLPEAFPKKILPALAACRTDGTFTGRDGAKLRYAVFSPERPVRTLVLLHGFTESIEKYHELCYYFLLAGFRVYVPDQRGHGFSARALPDLTLTHIDRFETYVSDFSAFMETVRAGAVGEICLFAHSMGGAVGALYLSGHPGAFARAFLSSPMVAPKSAVPRFLGKAILGGAVLLGKGEKRVFFSKPYAGSERFEDSSKTSRARFDEYEKIKETTPEFQNNGPTYRWALESLRVRRLILKKGAPERVKIPVFLAVAGQDGTVARAPQLALAARYPAGRVKIYPGAKHEIYGSADATFSEYLSDLLCFLTAGNAENNTAGESRQPEKETEHE